MTRIIATIVAVLLLVARFTGSCPHPVVSPSSSSAHSPTGQNQIPETERISWLACHYGRPAVEAQEIASAILYHSRKHSLDPYLVAAIIAIESSFNPSARSRAGARGRMQVMPTTAHAFGGDDLCAGCRYLAYLTSRFGSHEEILAAYNAGPTRIRCTRQITRWPRETREYVQLVSDLYQYLVNPRDNVYIVHPGDTLWAIARQNNITVKALVKLNSLRNPRFIRSGQILIIKQEKQEIILATDDELDCSGCLHDKVCRYKEEYARNREWAFAGFGSIRSGAVYDCRRVFHHSSCGEPISAAIGARPDL